MDSLDCCTSASFVSERDLDAAGGFDFMLGKCANCSKPWMSVFCTATGMGAYEPVSREDVEKIRSITDGSQLKRFMRSWGDSHL